MESENQANDTSEKESTTGKTHKLEHLYYEVGRDVLAKPDALCSLLQAEGKPPTGIFCNSPSEADLVEAILKRKGITARKMIGHQPNLKSLQVLQEVLQGEITALVLTDVSARDLNVESLDLVINYSIHDDPETYIHRIGTGETSGNIRKVISIVSPLDLANFHYLKKLLEFEFVKGELPSGAELLRSQLQNLEKSAEAGAHLEDAAVAELARELNSRTDAEKLIGLLLYNTIRVIPGLQQDTQRSSGGRDRYRDDEGEGQDRDDRRGGRGNDRDNRRGSRRDRDDDYGNREFSNGDRDRDDDRSRRREPPPTKRYTRLYLGQGAKSGLNEDGFKELISSKWRAPVDEEVTRFRLRDHYAFVDVAEELADEVVDALGAVATKNGDLMVKNATTILAPLAVQNADAAPTEGSEDLPEA